MKKVSKLLICLFFVFALHITLYTLHSYAAVPRLISYQGRLTDKENKPLEGAHNLTFRIYDAEGNLLWQETHQGVVIQKGIFSILLGSVTNLDLAFDKPYFLEIKVGDEVMSPRQQITSAGYAIRAEKADREVPVGTIFSWPASSPPPGYLLCDGSAVSRTVYNELFNLIGITFGAGDGSTTFNLPNLKGRVVVGYDSGQSYFNSLNKSGGESTHTLTVKEMPEHGHNIPMYGGGDIQRNRFLSDGSGQISPQPGKENQNATCGSGEDAAHNNLQPYLTLNYIIKY